MNKVEPLPDLYDSLHQVSLINDDEFKVIKEHIKKIPKFEISMANMDKGGTTTKAVQHMYTHLNSHKSEENTVKQVVNYHTRMVGRSFKSLDHLNIHNTNVECLSDAIGGLRQDIFWHRWYITEYLKNHEQEFNVWIGINKMWDNDPTVSQYYNDLHKTYSTTLLQLKDFDDFSVLLHTGVLATTLIPLGFGVMNVFRQEIDRGKAICNYKKDDIGGVIVNQGEQIKVSNNLKVLSKLVDNRKPIIGGVTAFITASYWFYSNKVVNDRNANLNHMVDRFIDCFRMYDKMYALSGVLSYDEEIDEEMNHNC